MDTLHEIRSVQRALLVLRVLNDKEVWTLQDLQLSTGLPKSTLHRILATLVAEHYVHSSPNMHGLYRLTQNVRLLSRGVVEKNRLADIGGPIAVAATKKHKWPMAIGVIEGVRVKAVFCTMPYSPYSMRPTCFGELYGLLNTALGNAYLAFCAGPERRILLDLLRKTPQPAATGWEIRQLIRRTRLQGYGVRAGVREDETSAIAVPIRDRGGGIFGVLACSTFSNFMDKGWISKSYRTAQAVADEIAAAYIAGKLNSDTCRQREHRR
ncbi:MAG: helix-turn-helix domain-containing protein [Burkholderiales bacterium]|nr:helix-turn-helix domain-containing protein [Burkholderiales bacterium]